MSEEKFTSYQPFARVDSRSEAILAGLYRNVEVSRLSLRVLR